MLATKRRRSEADHQQSVKRANRQPQPQPEHDQADDNKHEDDKDADYQQLDQDNVDETSDNNSDNNSDNDDGAASEDADEEVDDRFAQNFDEIDDPLAADDNEQVSSSAPLSSAKLNEFNAKLNATGMVYFSRLPPRMKPSRLRQMLSDYGVIGRIFLNPAPLGRRNQAGQTKHKRFTDGWVEFEDKKIAKRLAITFNGTLIGGKARSRWHDDMWNCMYLKGFKWHHLTEKLQHERRERESRLRQELSAAKSDTQEYRAQVEKAKVIEKVKEKRAKKATNVESNDKPKVFRTFHQRPALDR